MACTEVDPEKRRDYYLDVVMVADKLASFRSPRLASIHTSTAKVSALDRRGATEQQVMDELMAEIIAKIRETGELPRGEGLSRSPRQWRSGKSRRWLTWC
jgi:hypothetical protein